MRRSRLMKTEKEKKTSDKNSRVVRIIDDPKKQCYVDKGNPLGNGTLFLIGNGIFSIIALALQPLNSLRKMQ